MSVGLANFWHPVALASEVTDKPRRFRLLGEPLVLYRDGEGPVALSDLCIHRGAALSLGWTGNGVITCPYHGWSYDRTGRCVKIPSLEDGHPIPSKARTNSYRVQDAYGLVWVALAEPAAPLPPMPEWDDPAYHSFQVSDWEMKSSAGRVIDNSLDFSHFPWSHEGVLGSRDNAVVREYEPKETPFGLTNAYDHHIPASSPLSGGQASVRRMHYELTAPFTIVSRQTSVPATDEITVLTVTACPIDAKTSRVYHLQSRNFAHDIPDEAVRAATIPVVEQDRAIIESQRPEEIPVDLREELHIKVPDAVSIMYRKILARIGAEREYGL